MLSAVIVECPGQRILESLFVCSTVYRSDIVCEAQDYFVIAVVILDRHFGFACVVLSLCFEIYYFIVYYIRGALFVFKHYEALYSAFVAHLFVYLFLTSDIFQGDPNACIQKSLFSQSLFEDFITEFDRFKYLAVGFESDHGSSVGCITHTCKI